MSCPRVTYRLQYACIRHFPKWPQNLHLNRNSSITGGLNSKVPWTFMVQNLKTYNLVYSVAYNKLWIMKYNPKPIVQAIISILEHENCQHSGISIVHGKNVCKKTFNVGFLVYDVLKVYKNWTTGSGPILTLKRWPPLRIECLACTQ